MTSPAPVSPASRLRWFSASVLGFGLASFLSDAGYEAATTAMPALLVSLGAAPAALGLIEGIADGLASLARLIGGWLADRPSRRKPIAVAGYLVTGLAQGAFAVVTAWPQVLAVRGAGWIARGVRGPARDAMLAGSVPPEARGRAFGFHRAMDTAGAVVGPALAAALIAVVPLRDLFRWTLVPGVLAAVAFAGLVRRDDTPGGAERASFMASLRRLPRPFGRFVLAVGIFGCGDFARTLLILRAIELLGPTMGPARATAAAMSLYVVHNVVYATASYPVGWLADRGDPLRWLTAGYALGTLTAVGAALATPSLGMLVVLFVAAGLTLAFEDTLEGTITAHEVPASLRGSGYGLLAATNGLGDLISSALVGILWSALGPRLAFVAAALPCLAGTIALGAMARRSPARS